MAKPLFHMDAPSLLSKWGFGDGDALNEWWWDNYGEDFPGDTHEALHTLAVVHLMPLIRAEGWDAELVHIHTNHNPVRIERLNGDECDWYSPDDNALTDISVSLTREQIEETIAAITLTE